MRLTDVRALLGSASGRPADPSQLPHRHPHRLHDGADAVGAAPSRLPARPRRRRLPAARARRRRRRAGPQPDDRRARRPQRGPPAPARRDRGRDRDAGRHLHRRQRAHRPAPAARRTPRRAARRPRPDHRPGRCAAGSSSSTRSSRSTSRTSRPAGSVWRRRSRSTRRAGRGPSAAAGGPGIRPPFLTIRSSRGRSDDVALADLVAFFRDPVKGFFRALELTLPWDVEAVSDAMPVEIDNLEAVGCRRPDARRHAPRHPPRPGAEAEWRRGVLPPGQLGWRKATEIREEAMQLAIAALTHRQVDAACPRHRRRPRRWPTAHRHGDPRVRRPAGPVSYSRLDAKQLLESWIRLLALAAHDPDHNWTALTIGRPPGAPPRHSAFWGR